MSKSKPTYLVHSIFRSIQGEGRFSGWPATFVRFQGCNLDCGFCDTKGSIGLEGGTTYTLNRLVKAIQQTAHANDLLVLTGGEPCLQPLEALLEALIQLSHPIPCIHLETNGSLPIPGAHLIDHIVVSPKHMLPEGSYLKNVVEGADEIKWLVGGMPSIARLKAFMNLHDIDPQRVCLQPISQEEHSTKLAFKACLQLGCRLSVQVHKYIGVK